MVNINTSLAMSHIGVVKPGEDSELNKQSFGILDASLLALSPICCTYRWASTYGILKGNGGQIFIISASSFVYENHNILYGLA